MKGRPAKVVVAVALLGIMAWMWVKQFATRGAANASDTPVAAVKPAPTPAATTPTPTPMAASTGQTGRKYADPGVLELQNKRRNLPWVRDPFYSPPPKPKATARRKVRKAAPPPPPPVEMTARLGAILYSRDKPLVLLNGQTLTVGEQLEDGTRVMHIAPTAVTVVKQGKKFVLVLEEPN